MNVPRSRHSTTLMLGLGLGALLMYVFDPQQGRRRVALARQQIRHLQRESRALARTGVRDLQHRTRGLVARVGRMVRRKPVDGDDTVVVARVRSALGRVARRPHALHVTARAGCVRLSGPVLFGEEEPLLRVARSVPGVREVENELDVHQTADIPALQGGNGHGGGPRGGFIRRSIRNAPPGPRLVYFATGIALLCYAGWRRGLPGAISAAAGSWLASRSLRH